MVGPRGRSFRDAILVLVGATCMHLTTTFIHSFQPDLYSGDIIVNTEVHQQAPAAVPPPPAKEKVSISLPPPTTIDLAYDFPETTIDSNAPGWTVFHHLYMSNGTLFVVSPRPASDFPDPVYITSTGLAGTVDEENIRARLPTRETIDFITPEEAQERWGPVASNPRSKNRVWNVSGNTVLFNDPSQFLDHYYHFCAELILGTWAFWQGAHNAQVDPRHAELTTAPPFTRAIFSHANADGWRDRPGFNSYFFRAAFPSLTVEVQKDWEDRIVATSASGDHARAWHFDSVILVDRSAAFKGDMCGRETQRTAAEAYHFMREQGNLTRWWWEPVRRAVLQFAGVDQRVIDIGVRAQALEERQKQGEAKVPKQDVVISYIDRQGVRRHLVDEDHELLVSMLTELCAVKGWELNLVQAEKLTKEDQLDLASRSTVLLGVHGNGLTHLIMMSPTPISTVIEMFYPGGFAHDYEWTARALGHKHFAIWNDTYHTYPDTPSVDYPEGFQGTQIPVHAPTVIKIIEDRIAGRLP